MNSLNKFLIVFFFSLCALQVSAQNQTEDVIYLNNGSIYRGTIVEQVPNVSLKIQIMGGSIVAVQLSDIAKMTKEVPFSEQYSTAPSSARDHRMPKEKVAFVPRTKGYFFQGQLLMELLQGGMRFVNGYKFGRFGHLGIGVGFDALAAAPGNVNGNGIFAFSGVYLPIYLYYSGDIMKTRVTPFYLLEAGYSHPLNANNGNVGIMEDIGFGGGNSYEITGGGPMGTVGFGVRFNTKRRVNFSLLLNVGVKNVQYSELYYLYDDINGTYDYYGTTGLNATLFSGGLRFGVGF